MPMAQLPSRTSVMARSSKALQVLDGLSKTTELSRRSHFMLIEMRMETSGLHAHSDRRQVIRSRAAAGSAKPPTRKRSEKSALMASVWGTLSTPYCMPLPRSALTVGTLVSQVAGNERNMRQGR